MAEKARQKEREEAEKRRRIREVNRCWTELVGPEFGREEEEVLKSCYNLTSLTMGDEGFLGGARGLKGGVTKVELGFGGCDLHRRLMIRDNHQRHGGCW